MSSEGPSHKRWVPPPRPVVEESKFWRKAKQNPLVPIGCIGTVGVLCMGLLSFKRGNVVMSQKMMRLRVLFQGGTVLALVGGIALEAKNH
ncbi:PREDICTED: HIG1 domain family member 2A, mitochondrial-like [Amphimedon queenslandica]|uniref:HIG1 domain-containing protein n=1 Tax=Amphimedon queenslandica TaxID=400682 RepID=A0A1X7VNG8_AMPQE|nr:PREDICTED: HIG1 domain family member 2A, mitochondrial-like [Amphimedon queenslandica]|eukprot:XP_003383399.1 PREDICTED: HIG1 domain family member 2A, mitochondrial-like [Amphimedon queenslandica]